MFDDEHEIKNLSSVLGGVFDSLNSPDARKAGDAHAVWRKILLGIKSNSNPNEGANLAAHSRIVDLKNGVLLVEADHPGWIELLQLRKNFILKGLSMYAPNMGVQTFAFRVAGKRGNVGGEAYSAEEVRGLAEKRLEREESALAKAGQVGRQRTSKESNGQAAGNQRLGGQKTSSPSEEIPDGLKEALSALKRDMGA